MDQQTAVSEQAETVRRKRRKSSGRKAFQTIVVFGLMLSFLLIAALGLIVYREDRRLVRELDTLQRSALELQDTVGDLSKKMTEFLASREESLKEPAPVQAEEAKPDTALSRPVSYDGIIRSIAHRGFSAAAPENTLPAYILAAREGFYYVETDICFTADGVPVCLHDDTIDRTSNGTGYIGDLTLEELRQYDFGSWKSSEYEGTRIPTLEEFLLLCRELGLFPYLELKETGNYTGAQIRDLVNIVYACGMDGKVTWISFSYTFLSYIRRFDNRARLGYLVQSVTYPVILTAKNLRTNYNEVFIDSMSGTDEECQLCFDHRIPLEVWTLDSAEAILALNPYITGVASNSLIAGKILYEASAR
ncbi:MAG: hypothetical protein IKQ10_08010 [Oscillospiraceae bacterium]|nr:hypothetical protein [Oscillospiraceae bacterium]